MTMLDILELCKIISCSLLLVTSSIYDYKDRRVPDIVFKVFAPVAVALTILNIIISADILTQLKSFAMFIAVTIPIFYVIYYLGLFGGADAKIFMILSVAMPWPLRVVTPLSDAIFPIFSISIFNNTLLFSILTMPFALLSNLSWKVKRRKKLFDGLGSEPIIKKIGALLFCIKKEKSEIKPYDMIAEEDGKISLFKKVQEEDLTSSEIDRLPQGAFVSFSIPMVIFITLGFIAAIVFGDFIIFFLGSVMKI